MAWVKKNLFILIAALVSVGVLGYAIFFVQQKKAVDEEVTTNLDDAAQRFRDLISRKVHPGNDKPGQDNIQVAKAELGKVRSFTEEIREYLKGPQIATNLNNQMFRAQLDTSVAELRRQADEAGVALPNTNFWFTYNQYKTTVDFKDHTTGLAAQLEDIKSMMRILYDARVHSLAALRRVPVSDSEGFGTSDYIMNKYPRTNDWAVTTSYEVTFQGFSSELARVMEGLANAKQCFVVKTVGVAQAPEERKAAPPIFYQPPVNYGDRYGMGGRYGAGAMQPQMIIPRASTPAQRQMAGGMKTILDENKLRFTLQVDSVRLKGK